MKDVTKQWKNEDSGFYTRKFLPPYHLSRSTYLIQRTPGRNPENPAPIHDDRFGSSGCQKQPTGNHLGRFPETPAPGPNQNTVSGILFFVDDNR
jgi:hypothetical protein